MEIFQEIFAHRTFRPRQWWICWFVDASIADICEVANIVWVEIFQTSLDGDDLFVEFNKFFEDGPNIGHPLAHLEKFDLPSKNIQGHICWKPRASFAQLGPSNSDRDWGQGEIGPSALVFNYKLKSHRVVLKISILCPSLPVDHHDHDQQGHRSTSWRVPTWGSAPLLARSGRLQLLLCLSELM